MELNIEAEFDFGSRTPLYLIPHMSENLARTIA